MFNTYAPVVSWVNVRLILVISLVLNLQAQKVDYTNEIFQALLDQTVYVELPRGFEVPNEVFLL